MFQFIRAFILFKIIILIHATDINNPRSCPSSIAEPDRTSCCENLNKFRDDFVSCCTYPILVTYRDDYENCTQYCASINRADSRCCILNCAFKRLGIQVDDPWVISPQGLINSFTMSLNSTSLDAYSGIINDVVNTCTTLVTPSKPDPSSSDYGSQWDCFEEIPLYLYDIIDCTYDYNFLYCPAFPFDKGACYESFYYVYDCFVNNTLLGQRTLENDPRTSNPSMDDVSNRKTTASSGSNGDSGSVTAETTPPESAQNNNNVAPETTPESAPQSPAAENPPTNPETPASNPENQQPSAETSSAPAENPPAESAPTESASSTNPENPENQPPAESAPAPENQQPPAESAPNPENQQPSAESAPNPDNQQPSAESAPNPENQQPSAESAPNPDNQQPSAESAPNPENQQPSAESVPNPENQQQPPAESAPAPAESS